MHLVAQDALELGCAGDPVQLDVGEAILVSQVVCKISIEKQVEDPSHACINKVTAVWALPSKSSQVGALCVGCFLRALLRAFFYNLGYLCECVGVLWCVSLDTSAPGDEASKFH